MRVAIVVLLLTAARGSAPERPDPGLAADLFDMVRYLGEGGTCSRTERGVVIEVDAMTYQVHRPDRLGRHQPAAPERGPGRDGVVLEVDVLGAPYDGPLELPQRLRGPYYDTYVSEVAEADRHHLVRARFGPAFPEDLRRRVLERIGASPATEPPVRVSVAARADRPCFPAGDPLTLTVALRNRLATPIRFTTGGLEPDPSNMETTSVDLVDIHRDGRPRNLFLVRPELRPDIRRISGAASLVVAPGEELVLRVDAAKWTIDGGWIPGEYEVTVRLRNIAADARVTLSVLGEPVRFAIEAER